MLRVELRLRVLILSVSLLATVDCKNLLFSILPLIARQTCSQLVLNWDYHWSITVLHDSMISALSHHALHGFLFGGCRLDRCRRHWRLQHKAGTGIGPLDCRDQRPLPDLTRRPPRVGATPSISHHSSRADAAELGAEHHR